VPGDCRRSATLKEGLEATIVSFLKHILKKKGGRRAPEEGVVVIHSTATRSVVRLLVVAVVVGTDVAAQFAVIAVRYA